MDPKYKCNDKVRPLRESFIYIIDDYYMNDDNEIIYITHIDSPYTKIREFKEEDLTFAGFGY